jgi:hypothetical protein
MIISPSDVMEEREAVRQALGDFNARFGEVFGVSIEAAGWETHATPQMGAPPQAVLNDQVVDKCDLAVAVFWTRMGTPTDAFPSGSTEEVARLQERGVPVAVYFSDKPAPPSQIDPAQYETLRQLRLEYGKKGYLGTFDTVEQLRRQLTFDVASLVGRWLGSKQAQTEGAAARPGFVAAALPDVRVRLDVVDVLDGSFDKQMTCVRVTVENHSPGTVFLTGPSFATPDGAWALTQRDSMHAPVMEKRRLESGDSTSYVYTPEVVEQIIRGVPGDLVVHDAINRSFRAPDGALATALARAKDKPRAVVTSKA